LRSQHEDRLNVLTDELSGQFPDAKVTGRVKDRTEMLKKMATEPEKYSTVTDLPDISGARVFASKGSIDEERSLTKAIKSKYEVVDEKDYLENPKEGYRAIHLYVHDNETGINTEIQVRTPNQDRWANYTHDKVYKPTKEMYKISKQNRDVINNYVTEMSNHYYALDSGRTNVNKPDCPEIVRKTIGCMED
ncbi:MAG: RelA/SpoT domain-containing protein, partial [Acidobacteriota bacterium]